MNITNFIDRLVSGKTSSYSFYFETPDKGTFVLTKTESIPNVFSRTSSASEKRELIANHVFNFVGKVGLELELETRYIVGRFDGETLTLSLAEWFSTYVNAKVYAHLTNASVLMPVNDVGVKKITITVKVPEHFVQTDIDRAIQNVTDALYLPEEVTQDEYNLVINMLEELRKQLLKH